MKTGIWAKFQIPPLRSVMFATKYYLTPQKRENSPQAIINQNNLIDTDSLFKRGIFVFVLGQKTKSTYYFYSAPQTQLAYLCIE